MRNKNDKTLTCPRKSAAPNFQVKSIAEKQAGLLAPEIVHAILAGTLQKSISQDTLRKELPIRWADQKKLFGVE